MIQKTVFTKAIFAYKETTKKLNRINTFLVLFAVLFFIPSFAKVQMDLQGFNDIWWSSYCRTYQPLYRLYCNISSKKHINASESIRESLKIYNFYLLPFAAQSTMLLKDITNLNKRRKKWTQNLLLPAVWRAQRLVLHMERLSDR